MQRVHTTSDMTIKFPPVNQANEIGVLAVGGELTAENILHAYKQGIFPWPMEGYPVLWWAPPTRGVLELQNYSPSKSFLRAHKKTPFTMTFNQNFTEVIQKCASVPRKQTVIEETEEEQSETWITEEMITGYSQLFEKGFCFSLEVHQEGQLVGGIYGVKIHNYISAESMFHTVSNASKTALHALVEYCKSQGIEWIDLQVLNSFTETIGATQWPREQFIEHQKSALL